MTVHEGILEAVRSIAKRDAETLLAYVLQKERAWLLAHPEEMLSEAQVGAFRRLTARRAMHEPLQYIVGVQEFFGMPLKVTRETLIPRPETELLVEAVMEDCRQHAALRILDVGTGTGAIALALAKHLPEASVMACDVSEGALRVARENAEALGLRVEFFVSDLLSGVAAERLPVDVIASNPPYVSTLDAPGLQAEVRDYEPAMALYAGADGLDIYRRLIPQAEAVLKAGGRLAMEFGFGQRERLRELLKEWEDVRFVEDYAGIPRVVLARKV